MENYKGYELRESNGIKYPYKERPYDDAYYYYARTKDGVHWTIGYNNEQCATIKGCFEEIVDLLEKLNKDIKPIICYN